MKKKSLKLTFYPKPTNPQQRKHNKESKMRAEMLLKKAEDEHFFASSYLKNKEKSGLAKNLLMIGFYEQKWTLLDTIKGGKLNKRSYTM